MSRSFVRLAFGSCVLAILFASQAQAGPLQAYIGTYTAEHPNPDENHGQGIYLVTVDPVTGFPGLPKLMAKTFSPAWITLSADHKFLYAANEYDGFGLKKSGSVSAYAVDAVTGALKLLNTVSSEGAGPAYISVHASGKFVMVANYTAGTFAIIRIRPDGSLGEASDVIGPFAKINPAKAADNPSGQFAFSDHDGSRAHMIASDPTGQFVIGDDAGRDVIFVW
jgi:6-phosphogluconolactonase